MARVLVPAALQSELARAAKLLEAAKEQHEVRWGVVINVLDADCAL